MRRAHAGLAEIYTYDAGTTHRGVLRAYGEGLPSSSTKGPSSRTRTNVPRPQRPNVVVPTGQANDLASPYANFADSAVSKVPSHILFVVAKHHAEEQRGSFISWNRHRRRGSGPGQLDRRRHRGRAPMGRFTAPDDVARAVASPADPEQSSFVNGHTLSVETAAGSRMGAGRVSGGASRARSHSPLRRRRKRLFSP